MHVTRRRFEQLVAEALDALPVDLLERASNVAVLVEDAPSEHQLAHMGGAESRGELFGLFESDELMPDRITLFRLPLGAACENEDELFGEIRVTLVHEFAHHFGIDDDRLDELGWS